MPIEKKEALDLGLQVLDTTEHLEDAKQEKINAIKKLLPDIVNSDNKLNAEKLEELLGLTNTTYKQQGYELTFAGKSLANAKASEPTEFELKLEAEQSKNINDTNNVIIRGDNLDVLKILKQNYNNKIKMIYIDPPYNTGNDGFVYHDNFKVTESDLIEKFSLNEDNINYLHNIYGNKTHSSWLSFMYPRLKLAKDLLTEDGVIFISIDDNEQANLKLLCDEIFGEENLVIQFTIKTSNINGFKTQGNSPVRTKDYCLLYAKNKNMWKYKHQYIKNDKKWDAHYNMYSEDGINVHKLKDVLIKNEIISEDTSLKNIDPSNTKFKNFYLENKYCIFQSGASKNDKYKILSKEKKDRIIEEKTSKGFNKWYNGRLLTSLASSLNFINECKEYDLSVALSDIISDIDYNNIQNETPVITLSNGQKPVKLIKRFIRMSTNDNDLILDFFAGSGTTGHAVMQLNKEDGGNRKYIMVQIDESIDKSNEGYKFCVDNNLEPVISSITIERLNRAGEKLLQEQQEEKDKKATQKKAPTDAQEETKEVTPLDIGYKVFSLVEKPKLVEEESGNYELIHRHEKSIDIIYNMLSKADKPLDSKIEEIEKDSLYKVEDGYYIINNISEADTQQLNIEALKDSNIYIDGYSNIQLEKFLNLLNRNNINKDSVKILY